jgi:hypothetical protein
MRCDLGFSAKSSIALIAGLFGLLAVVRDQPWLASLEAKESANSEPDLVAYFVSWHVTEHGSSHDFEYFGSLADPQDGYSEKSHSMNLDMTGSAIERYRADNTVYFDIRFLTVTLRHNDNNWVHNYQKGVPGVDCTATAQDVIIDPGAYSGFHADFSTHVGTWDLLGGLEQPDRRASGRLEKSFAPSLDSMTFINRHTSVEQGPTCNGSQSQEYLSHGGFSVVLQSPQILEADSADRTSFSLNRKFAYISSAGSIIGAEKRYVTWTAHAYRMGKCAAHDAPIQDGDPIIDHEQVDIDADRAEVDPNTSAGADANVAKLKIRVSCEGVPVEKAEVEINVDAQEQSGGHLHSDDQRPRGTIDGQVVTKAGVKRTTDANGEVKLKYGAPLTGYVDHANYGDYKIGIAGTYKVSAKSHLPDAIGTVAILA